MFVIDESDSFAHTNVCLSLADPGSGLSPGAIAGICVPDSGLQGAIAGISVAVAVLLLSLAAVGIYYYRRNPRSGKNLLQIL